MRSRNPFESARAPGRSRTSRSYQVGAESRSALSQTRTVDPADLKILAKSNILNGATDYPAWTELLAPRAGDVVDDVAKQAGLSPETVRRQIYTIARAIAHKLGVEAKEALAEQKAPQAAPDSETKLIPEADKLVASFRKIIQGIEAHVGDDEIIKDNTKLMAHVKLITGRSSSLKQDA